MIYIDTFDNISDAFPFIFLNKKGGDTMTKREFSLFIIILLLFYKKTSFNNHLQNHVMHY